MMRVSLKTYAFMFFGIIALQLSSCKEERKSSEVKQVKISFKKEGELQLKKAVSVPSCFKLIDSWTRIGFKASMTSKSSSLEIFAISKG